MMTYGHNYAARRRELRHITPSLSYFSRGFPPRIIIAMPAIAYRRALYVSRGACRGKDKDTKTWQSLYARVRAACGQQF